MKRLALPALLVGLLALLLFLPAFQTQKAIAPGKIEFFTAGGMYKVEGSFADWAVTKVKNEGASWEDNLEVWIEIKTGSVQERSSKLAKELRSEKFFYADLFPTCQVHVHDVKSAAGSDGTYSAVATLTWRDKSADYPFQFARKSGAQSELAGELVIKRSDFQVDAPKNVENAVRVVFVISESVLN